MVAQDAPHDACVPQDLPVSAVVVVRGDVERRAAAEPVDALQPGGIGFLGGSENDTRARICGLHGAIAGHQHLVDVGRLVAAPVQLEIGLVPELEETNRGVVTACDGPRERCERLGGRGVGLVLCRPGRRVDQDGLQLQMTTAGCAHDVIRSTPVEASALRLDQRPRKLDSYVGGTELGCQRQLAIDEHRAVPDAVASRRATPPAVGIGTRPPPGPHPRLDVDPRRPDGPGY